MLNHHLEKLSHFVGVVRAGSIRSYALSSRLSQPAVSRSIQTLESALESSLIHRTREGVNLTPSGRLLYEFAENLLQQCSQVEQNIRAQGKLKLSGNLVMGVYPSIGVYFIPKFLTFIAKEQGGLKLSVSTRSSKELISALRQGKLDLAITVEPPQFTDLISIPLYTDTFSIYRKTNTDIDLPKDLIIYTVGNALDSDSKSIMDYVTKTKFSKNVSDCGDFETARAIAEVGAGWAILPERVAEPAVASGHLENVIEPKSLYRFGRHNIMLSYRKHRTGDKNLLWITDQLSKLLK